MQAQEKPHPLLRAVVRCNNAITRLRRIRIRPENLLLLLPHCLQNGACDRNIRHDVSRCGRCGRCDVSELLALRDKYGLRCSLVSGGRQALAALRRPEVRAVVAVACEKELCDGIRASLPKPVLAVPNLRPNGPCKDTRVLLADVEAAVRELLVPDALPPEEHVEPGLERA